MKRLLVALVLTGALVPAADGDPPGHRLPEGPQRPLRDRAIDIQHLAAALRVDMTRETVEGTVEITFVPLRASLTDVELDAAPGLDVSSVTLDGSAPLALDRQRGTVRVTLPEALRGPPPRTLRVTYAARPRSGLYFFPGGPGRAPQAWNYGEGGIHYGWLPLYNGTDDRFSLDLRITAPRPLVVVANGTLRETVDNADGTRTFHWAQAEPIPNYLIALQVGDFARVPLDDARLATRTVPLAVWTIPGTEANAASAFGATPRMVEFFSRKFGYEYPWPRYDQVTLREFSGAMETTGAVGFSESFLRGKDDPPDSAPSFAEAYPAWTGEDTIAHELAHHWFGDLVTCRSLASLWLNESFASFAHLLWTGEAHGEDDLTYQRWRYLNRYLDYVRATGTVRPLEFDRYASTSAMYQEETTYLKGAIVLHMLRHIVGDADFFRGISLYLKRHAFGEVESVDLEAALREASGRNLRPFFEDWIRGGGGHPSFAVSYRYAPARRQVDLTIRQVQADLPFENAFHLPVQVEIVTAAGARVHEVVVDGWTTQVSLPADGRPSYVVFDKGGWLVSETRQERPLEEALRQLKGGGLAEKLRAAREVCERFPRSAPAVAALAAVLADPRAHWGLRQEAAVGLGRMGGPQAVAALAGASRDPDRRTRRAVALGLAAAGGSAADAELRRMVEADAAQDVVAVAAAGVGKLRGPDARAFLERQLPRASAWWDAIQLGVVQGLAELQDPGLGPVFERFVDPRYSRQLRQAALNGWVASAPDDPRLPGRLRELARDRNLGIRDAALNALGGLHRAEDLGFLREYAEGEADENLAVAARGAAETIEAFTRAER
jgi:aminopeptidase N